MATLLEKTVKYNWYQQKNGNYTILAVPIFAEFSDKERGSVDASKLQEFISNFVADRDGSWWPRLMIGHHNLNPSQLHTNNIGVGYVDNLNIVSSVIYADFVEVIPSAFGLIKQLRYPGRSVEFDSPERTRITSVSLLETREPYFRFPILALADNQVNPTQFQRKKEYVRMIHFSKGGSMPDILENKDKDKEPGKDQYQDEPPPKDEGGESQVMKLLQDMCAKLDSLVAALAPKQPQMQQPPIQPANPGTSDSVAMSRFQKQAEDTFAKIDSRLQQMEQHSSTQQLEEQVRAVCATNPDLQFDNTMTILRSMKNSDDRKKMLDMMVMMSKSSSVTSAATTQFARGFDFSKATSNKTLEKFKDKPSSIQVVAKKAYNDYQETITQPNERAARQFAAIWKTVDEYVSCAVEGEEFNAGEYERQMHAKFV